MLKLDGSSVSNVNLYIRVIRTCVVVVSTGGRNSKRGGEMSTKNKDKVLVLRHDEDFLDEIENWRAAQRPMPSRSEAVRTLTMRAIATEKYLSVILENLIAPMASAGLLDIEGDKSIYPRIQDFVLENVKFAAHLESDDQAERLQAVLEFLQEQAGLQETIDSEKAAS